MSEAIKTFQTLDSKSKILLIFPKGNLSYVFKKGSYCDKDKIKDSKNF